MIELHPLINPSQLHYDADGKQPAIQILEKTMTVAEMIGACKFSMFKYRYRQNLKGQKASDLIKIETYENYLKVLENCIVTDRIHQTVERYFQKTNQKFRYSV